MYMCALLRVQPALLVHLKSAGSWWLNSALSTSSVLQQAYFVLGWLTAQSLTNRCTLGLPIAPLLFHLLLMPAPDTKFQVRWTRRGVFSANLQPGVGG